ncbi:DUF4781 domain-containing protein, partial [Variovorax sp. WDL1]|uniref:DUF4781 domain-containing protein n=1 Tax=Variovorax sp. WDL1 TaxID=207745 RepID=UPI000A4064C7
MVAPAGSSQLSGQAAIDNAAALRAAEEARRRAEEAARRAAEEARRQAEEARRLAQEARKKADQARKDAEAAEAKAAQSKDKADQADAAKLRTQASKDETDALKKEATANLRDKEKTLAGSKLDDVQQRRPENDPSEGTRAAQSEVAAAKKTVALYDSPPGAAPAADRPANPKTQALLDKAEKAAKPVFDAQARGEKPKEEDKAALNKAVDEWLTAAQQDMRNAAVQAQAQGQDPKKAIRAQADKLRAAVDKGGVFEPTSMGENIDQASGVVKAESPAMRQLRSEQYDVQQDGRKQVADGRQAAADADAAADKAEAYAKSFGDGPGGNDTIITAKQNAKDEATRLRKLSNEANDRLDGLVRTYGGTAPDRKDPDKTQSFIGSVNADYNVRVADLEVSEASRAYELAKTANDPKQLAAAQDALDLAIDARDIVHAVRDDAAAELERSDSAVELRDAKAAYDAEKEKQPQPYKVKHHGGFLQGDYETTELPEGYDWTFEVTPGSEMARQVKDIDGKWYYVIDLGNGEQSKTEMNPVTARLWAAQKKADAANANADGAAAKFQEIQSDLIGDGGQDPKIDPARFIGNAGKIDTSLTDANDTVATTQAKLRNPAPPPGVQGVWAPSATPEQMGVALQNQAAAQKNADALKAMRELRQAQYDQAAGKTVDAKHLQDLKTKARDAQREAGEAQPSLTPAEEADITSNKLPAARQALEAQEDEVTRLTAPDSKATQAQKDAAQNKYDQLDLDVRDYETRLELEHAKQASLGAPYAYAAAPFVKPQDTLLVEKRTNSGNYGKTIGTDIYADNYDPTWNIVPGKDGKVNAEGLPRGLSPDDIEVRYNPCGGGYTVTFKKSSEVLGRRSDGIVNYVVQKGTYKMHPATAELWNDTNTDKRVGGGRLIAAQQARDELLAERKQTAADAPPSKDAPPVIGPDGKPVPKLNFADDLGPRKKAVDQKVADANGKLDDAQRALDAGTGDKTRLTQARDDARAERDIALAEQKAVDAVLLWQEANRTRQLYEANERAGRLDASHAKPPREHADEMHAKAETARNGWITARNQHYKQVATRELGAAEKAHDDWKKAHPGLSDSGSDTWKALQEAKVKDGFADRVLAAGANEEAAAREYQYIAENLSPEQHDDPRALYRLFDKDPARMAQSIINSHFVQYGGQPTQMESRTHLANEVATALGWQPTTGLDPNAPATNDRLRRTQDLYTGLGKEQKEMRDKIVDRIIEDGGEKARVTVLPVVYALDGEKGGIVKTAIFKVENKDDPKGREVEFVDEQAWTYDSLDDFRANNSLPVEGVQLAMPSDGNFTLDDRGNVKLYTGDARTETGWETFRRTSHIDWVVGGVGLVAGVVLTVGSLGTLSAPGVMLAAGSLTLLAAGYGTVTSAQSLYKQGSHGQDINPFTSTQARLDWLNLGLSVAAVPVVGASTRATVQAMRARNALQAALKEAGKEGGDAALAGRHFADYQRYTQSAQAWGQPASAMSRPFASLPVGVLKKVGPLDAGSAYAFEEGARYLHDNWDQLAPGERSSQFAMLAMNASGFASPVFAKGYVRVHDATRARFGSGAQGFDPSQAAATFHAPGDPQAGTPVALRTADGAPEARAAAPDTGPDVAVPPPGRDTRPAMPTAGDDGIVVPPPGRRPARNDTAEPAADVDPVTTVALPLSRSTKAASPDGTDGGTGPGGERRARHSDEALRQQAANDEPVQRRERSPHRQERRQSAAPDPLAQLREPPRDPAVDAEMARLREDLYPEGFDPGENRGSMLFRLDTQAPERLRAAGGVQPRPANGAVTRPSLGSYVEANTSGRWVSTSQTVAHNKAFLARNPQRVGEGETAYMYVLNPDARSRTDVLAHYVGTGRIDAIPGPLRETIAMEGEVAIDGAVPWQRVYGWAEIDAATGRFVRPFVRNPDYGAAAAAPRPRQVVMRRPDPELALPEAVPDSAPAQAAARAPAARQPSPAVAPEPAQGGTPRQVPGRASSPWGNLKAQLGGDGSVRLVGADGRPLGSRAMDPATTEGPAPVVRVSAEPTGPVRTTPDWDAVRTRIMAAPADAQTRFVVSRLDAEEVIFGGATLGAKRRNTYASFEEARAAAAEAGGAWVHRVQAAPGRPSLVRRGQAEPDEIVGAVRIGTDGQAAPVPVVNLQSRRGPVLAGGRGGEHQTGESTSLATREPDMDALLEGPSDFTRPRPAYAGPRTLAEAEAGSIPATDADVQQTLYLSTASSPDGHGARDIPLRRRFAQWARGDAPAFLGTPDFVGGRYVLAKEAARINQGERDAGFELLDRSHVYSSFETARAAAAQANDGTSALVGVVRLIGPKTAMAEVVASGRFRNDQVDGIVGVRADGSVHPVSVANRDAAHAPKPGEQFIDPRSTMKPNEKVFTPREKTAVFVKTAGYMIGTGAAFYAAVRWGGGALGLSAAGVSLATYVGARNFFLRYAFDAFLYRGGVAGLRQGAKIRLLKHLDPKHQDSFALIENIADPARREAALFQLKNQLDSWHATRRGIGHGERYREALDTLARDPANIDALQTLQRGAQELSGRRVSGTRGWLRRVPPALRREYAEALKTLQNNPADVHAAALLTTAPDVGRGTQHAGALRGRVLRNVPHADRLRYQEAIRTLAAKGEGSTEALKVLQGIPLDTVQRHTTGARGALRGIPKADRHSIELAAETLRVNPEDARSQEVLDGSPGKLTSPNSPMGRTLFGMRVLSFGLSHSAGTRLYLNPIFDAPTQQWRWDVTTADGLRQWIGNEGSLHYAIGNATGLGATVANRYATLYKARTGKDFGERGEQESAAATPARTDPDGTPAPDAAKEVPVGKNGKPVPVYKATDSNSKFVLYLKGLGKPAAVKHPGVNEDGTPMVKPSFIARLPQYSSWGDSSGTIGLTLSDAILGGMYIAEGNWGQALPQVAKVASDIAIFRGTRKDYLDEYGSNRGKKADVDFTRVTDFFNAPLGEAKVKPTRFSESAIRRGWA